MGLEVDCHGLEITSNFELFVTFGMSLDGVCMNLNNSLQLIFNLEGARCDQNFLRSHLIRYEKVMNLEGC